MKRWTELIVRTAELVEAEGRALRGAVHQEARAAREWIGRLGVGATMLTAGVLLILTGAGLVLAGVFLWLESAVGTAGAAALSGALAVGSGASLLWMFRRTVSP